MTPPKDFWVIVWHFSISHITYFPFHIFPHFSRCTLFSLHTHLDPFPPFENQLWKRLETQTVDMRNHFQGRLWCPIFRKVCYLLFLAIVSFYIYVKTRKKIFVVIILFLLLLLNSYLCSGLDKVGAFTHSRGEIPTTIT